SDLPFVVQYIATALWSSNDESDESGGEPFDTNYDASDLAPETLEKMRADCEDFFTKAAPILDTIEHLDYENVAHNFWLTRNGHGAGFWDGDYPELQGDQLTELSKEFGEVNLYLGDDGQIYIA
ncbi:MAG: hypothetical protein M0R22_00590, partial [Dehalococcoidia bacterium]|nr:hypothetical protein [Dehalococcoidia bacterium]